MIFNKCTDVFDKTHHPDKGLVNIFSGQIVDDPSVNAYDSIQIGTAQWHVYENSWQDGFHNPLKKSIKSMAAATKKKVIIGDTLEIVQPDFIYARAMGIMASSREGLSLETLFDHELSPIPASLFDDSGEMREANKSVLKAKLKVDCGTTNTRQPKVLIIDGCALLWAVA